MPREAPLRSHPNVTGTPRSMPKVEAREVQELANNKQLFGSSLRTFGPGFRQFYGQMLFLAIPNSQTAQETSAGGGHLEVSHAALGLFSDINLNPEQNLDLNLTVHKMRPIGGLAVAQRWRSWSPVPSETPAFCGAGGDHARLTLPTHLSQVGPRRTDLHLPQVCSLCKARMGRLFSDPPGFSGTAAVEWGIPGSLSRTPQADPAHPPSSHLFTCSGQKLSIVDSSLLVVDSFT